jgi:DNA-binding transcriptional MerR regulator
LLRELSFLMKGDAMLRLHAMTIGQLSKRTGVPIKVLRTYEGLGFLSTRGRSEGNYRLFGEETLRCVQIVQELRSLGLTLKEIQALITRSCQREGSPVDELLHEYLAQALARVEERLSTLQALRQRILEFQAAGTSRPEASALAQLLARNPCCGSLS